MLPLDVPPPVRPHVRAAMAGDEKATRELLTELLPRIRNLVRYLVRGDDECEDITQDALVAVLQEMSSYRGEGKFEAWVDRIVARLTLSRLRRRRFQWQRDTQYSAELMLVSEHHGGDEFMYRRQVVRLLDTLPLEQRHVLVLHVALDMTVPELASALSIPAETVRSRLRLAKSRLRTSKMRLRGHLEDEPQ